MLTTPAPDRRAASRRKDFSGVLPPDPMAPATGEPIYRQVEEMLRAQIAQGRWAEGERIPSLRELSADLGVAYATVARSVRALVEDGTLDARTSRGTVVAPRRMNARSRSTAILSRFQLSNLLETTRYYRQLLFLIQETLVDLGQTVVYNRWNEDMSLQEALDRSHDAKSLVIFGTDPVRLDEIKATIARGTAVVCVGDTFFDPEIPAVHTTNESDTARAVREMYAMGCKNIVALLPDTNFEASLDTHFTWARRVAGFRRAIGHANAPREQLSAAQAIIGGTPAQQAGQLLNLKTPPDGLIWLDGVKFFPQLYSTLRGTSLALGDRVRLAAWDENLWSTISPLGLEYLSIEQPLNHIADIATSELMRMLEDSTYRAPLGQVTSQLVWIDATGERHVRR